VVSLFIVFLSSAEAVNGTLRVYYKSTVEPSCLGSHTHWPRNKDTTRLTSVVFRAYSLHEACKVGCLGCVKYLLNAGAFVNHPSPRQGYTSLDFSDYAFGECSNAIQKSLHQSVSKYLESQGGTRGECPLKRARILE
jgi:hypothetical protein